MECKECSKNNHWQCEVNHIGPFRVMCGCKCRKMTFEGHRVVLEGDWHEQQEPCIKVNVSLYYLGEFFETKLEERELVERIKELIRTLFLQIDMMKD